jgi:hypothetical protein
MIDNFKDIQELLEFGKDTYYYLQVIRRRKDPGNEDQKEPERSMWCKFVCRPESLERRREEIIGLCNHFNARAYIELNPRSLEKFTILCARKFLDRVYYHDYTNVFSVQNSIALSEDTISTRSILMKRRWMFDIDRPEDLQGIRDWATKNEIVLRKTIPTPNGYHQLIDAFNYTNLGIKLGTDFTIKTEEGTEITTSVKSTSNTILYCP